MVSSLATYANKPHINYDAYDEVDEEYNGARNERIFFWTVYIFGVGFLWLTATLGTLLAIKLWDSWVWLIPLVILLGPVFYGVLRHGRFVQFIGRLLLALLAMVIVWIGLLVVIGSYLPSKTWGVVVGSDTMGYLGIAGTVPLIGAFICFVLAFVLPVYLIVELTTTLVRQDLSGLGIFKVLILSALVPFGLVLPMGLSIVMNSGL
jgi:hypothetical protein